MARYLAALTFLPLSTLLLSPGAFADLTINLDPAQATLFEQCILAHSRNTGECWVFWTDTTVTLSPSTVFTDVFVSVTATLLPPMPGETESSGVSVPGTAIPASKSTSAAPMETSSPSVKAKSSSGSRPEASRPLLSMVGMFLGLVCGALQLAAA